MSKHGLQVIKSNRPVPIEPEIVDSTSRVHSSSSISPETRDRMCMDVVQGSIDIARKIVDGQQQIATIRANSDAAVAQIAAEIDKITAEAKAYVDKSKAESEAWHKKFEDRRMMVESFLSRLDDHPEWPESMRLKIVDAAIAALGVG